MEMTFFGDPHGDFSAIGASLADGVRPFSVFLGDFDLDRPLDLEVAALEDAGSEVWFVHGNHDADTPEWHDFVFSSALAERNLSGRIVDLGGYRVAGLGGVFRTRVWNPRSDAAPGFPTRRDFLRASRDHWRGGLPLRHRATVFPEDFERLARQRADILVTHEAPSSHRFGFEAIDRLARQMGVRLIVHGHHHEPYQAVLPDGVVVIGMGMADWRNVDIEGVIG